MILVFTTLLVSVYQKINNLDREVIYNESTSTVVALLACFVQESVDSSVLKWGLPQNNSSYSKLWTEQTYMYLASGPTHSPPKLIILHEFG